MYLNLLKKMFLDMVVKKDYHQIPNYYHHEFKLYTNGTEMDYETFLQSHVKYYASSIQYQIEYDEKTFLEQDKKIAGRMWITTSKPNESPTKIEVILIVEFKNNKIFRLWEITYPDWSQLSAFKKQ